MPNRKLLALSAVLSFTLAGFAGAQISSQARTSLVQPRIRTAIDDSARVTLPNTRSPRAAAANDLGAVPGDLPLPGITLVFSRSAAQQAALDALLLAQQDPTSPQYHQWLTPAQFGAQFGLADADLAATKSWLEAHGFTILDVSPSRDRITLSGNARQVESAFGTSLHYYREAADASNSATDTEAHFAPATDVSLPAALASSVLAVNNLSSFRLKPHVLLQPAFTSAQTGSHFIQPGDLATIYDVNAAYNAGYTGSNVSIAVVGQTQVSNTDLNNFQAAAGLPTKNPTPIIVPNSGTAYTSTKGDVAESDLDLEYSSAIAKGANVYFYYTGNNSNYGVFDALNYAVQQNIAQVITISYGACEPALGSTNINTVDAVLQQGASQGQTIVASSGDDGSTDCQQSTGLSSTTQYGLAVDYPASSAYVTGIGGSEFPTASTAASNSTYFTAASGTDVVASAKSYIPEQAWNDSTTASSSLSSGGGGVSVYTARPSWQTGSFGGVAIQSGSYRLVPDVSLDASNGSAPFLYCTSDTTAYSSGQSGSCTHGFRDNNSTTLTIAGGTSFSAPIFAGMVALIVQAKGGAGLGLINPTLYTLAANTANYTNAFHDITTGSNACLGSASVCSGTGASTNYAAATGYDLATGLGSVDLNALISIWPNPNPLLSASKITLTPVTTTPAPGATDTISISVASAGTGVATPTGTVSVRVDGGTATTLTLVGGTTTYNFSSTVSGQHTVTVLYSGDSNYKTTGASVVLTVGGTFSLSATNVSVTAGNSGASTVTVTPAGGYTGTVAFTAANSTITNACYTINNATVTGTAAVTTTLTLYTSGTTCSTVVANGIQAYRLGATGGHSELLWTAPPAAQRANRVPAYAAVAGALLLLTLRRRKLGKRLAAVTLSLGLLLALGTGLTGCSDKTTVASTTNNNTPTGSYVITLTGADTVNGSLTASTTLTLTVN